MKQFEKIQQWILQRTSPFDRKDIIKNCNVTYSAARQALDLYMEEIKCYSCHVGNGNFRTTFFPLDWTDEQCWEYMDSQTKSGKTKAKLYLFGSKNIPRISGGES